jgi:hypothetical protein
MPITIGDGLSFCGRALSEEELALIRQITRELANLALTELAATVSELLGWQRPNGGLKTRECYLFLRELHKRGWLPWLPAAQARLRRNDGVKPMAELVTSPVVLSGPLETYRPVRLQLLQNPRRPSPVPLLSQRLSLLGLPCSIRCATTLLCARRTAGSAAASRSVVQQRSLAPGAA